MKNKNLLNLDQNILVAIVNDLNNGKINEALIALERLINEFPGHALLFNLRGACFESKSQYEKSIEVLVAYNKLEQKREDDRNDYLNELLGE